MDETVGILAPALQPRDTIAFISPSSRLNRLFPGRLYRGRTALENLGYRVKIFFNDSEPQTFQETVLMRCHEIHSAFSDPEVKAIICTIGGVSANELIRHLDYDLIKANPKIFCGYSDITLLHHAIFTQTSLRTFYGPAVLPTFGEFPKPLDFTTSHFQKILQNPKTPIGKLPRSIEWTEEFRDWMGTDALRPRHLSPSRGWEWLRPGKATGRIFGGCLPSVLQLTGTKFFPDYRGRILFLENPEGEVFNAPLPFENTRSLMADLANVGVFELVSGLVVGRPYGYTHDEEQSKEFKQMILDQCHGTSFPILFNVDIGHTDPMLTIPLNTMASLDSEKDEFAILEAGVKEREVEKGRGKTRPGEEN